MADSQEAVMNFTAREALLQVGMIASIHECDGDHRSDGAGPLPVIPITGCRFSVRRFFAAL
jgi:hypothetical protein